MLDVQGCTVWGCQCQVSAELQHRDTCFVVASSFNLLLNFHYLAQAR
jgi:hypothetical protein